MTTWKRGAARDPYVTAAHQLEPVRAAFDLARKDRHEEPSPSRDLAWNAWEGPRGGRIHFGPGDTRYHGPRFDVAEDLYPEDYGDVYEGSDEG